MVYNSSDLLIEIGSKNNGYVAYYAKVVVDNGDAICADDGYSYTLTNEGFLFREKDSKYELIYYVGGEETATLPFDINGNSYSLFFMEGVRNVIIPEGFIEISSNAFNNCYSLISVDIPDSIEFIGGSAFNNCNSLTSVVIGHRVTFIGYEAFYNCDSLSEVYYNGTQEDWAKIYVDSSGNDSLKNATRYYYSETHPTTEGNFWHWVDGEPTVWCYDPASIPAVDATCTETGLSEGKYCEACGETLVAQNITDVKHNFVNNICVECGEVYYSKGLVYTSNGDGTCYLSGIGTCTDTKLVIPAFSPDGEKVTAIDGSAFRSNTEIVEAVIPLGVVSIIDEAFAFCNSLKSVTIPDSVTQIGDSAFYMCVSLEEIVIPNSTFSVGDSAFYGCEGLRCVTLGASVTEIGDFAFSACSALEKIEVSEQNTAYRSVDGNLYTADGVILVQYAVGCGATSFTVPEGVIAIGAGAFRGCESLTSLSLYGSVISINDYAFDGCASLKRVYYAATSPEWQKVAIGEGNEPLTGASILYNFIN